MSTLGCVNKGAGLMDVVRQVRDKWQFFRDRRPETYGLLTAIE